MDTLTFQEVPKTIVVLVPKFSPEENRAILKIVQSKTAKSVSRALPVQNVNQDITLFSKMAHTSVLSAIMKTVQNAKTTSVIVRLAFMDLLCISPNKSAKSPSFPTASLSSTEAAKPVILDLELLQITLVKMTAKSSIAKCVRTINLAPSARPDLFSPLQMVFSAATKTSAKQKTAPRATQRVNVCLVSVVIPWKKIHA